MNEKNNNIEEEDKSVKIYELALLFVPTLGEDEVLSLFNKLKDSITENSFEIISDEMPKIMDLAYTMIKDYKNVKSRYDKAYFSWIKFQIDTDFLSELKEKLDLDPNIIRFLIIKTVRENTVAPKRLVSKEGMTKRRNGIGKREEKKEQVPMDKKEVDKEIDAILAS